MIPTPFFIVGYERSGTTLLAAAFDRHNRIAVPPETHFFTDLCAPENAGQAGEPAAMVNHLFRGARIRDLNLDRAELLRRFASGQPTWANLFLHVLKMYADSRGKDQFGEKTPNHWRAVRRLLELFPDCRIIWMVRDGRDTILSLMKTPWKAHASLALHAMQWSRAMDHMLLMESQFPDRILRVGFEELVRYPAAELTRACEFIGVGFEPGQLDPSVDTGVVPEWERAWKGRVFSPLDPSRIGAAAREMPEPMLRILNSAMESTMRKLGYSIDSPAPLLSQAS